MIIIIKISFLPSNYIKMTIQLWNVKLAKKEQLRRRTILIGVKNLVEKMILNWRTIWKTSDWRFIDLKALYDDLQNFLYWTDFCWEPYLVSIEEVEYYVNLYRDMNGTMKNDLQKMLEEA